MFNRKRFFYLVLTVILVLSIAITGCSPTNETAQNDKGNATTQPESPSSDKPGEQKIVTLNYLSYQDKFDPQTDYTRERIKELLKYDIVPTMGTEDDKVNLILSSGQEYDIINLRGKQRNLLGAYIKNGAIQPLNDAIDKYGPNLKKAFSQEMWDIVSSDGKIYAIPNFTASDVDKGIVVREDWLKKLNLPIPTTVDEFYNVIKAFKEKDPGNVGDKLIPFAIAGGEAQPLDSNGLAQAFGLGRNPDSFIEKDGKIVNGLETPGIKEYLSFMNKLYSEGLLDPEFPINKKEKLIEKVGSGVVGAAIFSAWDSAALKALQATQPEANLIYLPPLKDKDGKQRIQSNDGLYMFAIVPKVSKKVDEVVKYANAFLDPANHTKLILGDEGVSYKVENGKYIPIFPEFNKYNKGRWFYPVNDSKTYTPLFGARARKEKEMGQMYDDANAKSAAYFYTDIAVSAPMMPSVEEFGVKLDILVKDRLVKMVLDKKELDKYDQLLKEWKEKGGDAITADYNNWFAKK